ncbi:MAG: hypothetical protein HY438_02875 [DPANN group archaeon]|nr:hypothetical protein [DPANN group archaeon]
MKKNLKKVLGDLETPTPEKKLKSFRDETLEDALPKITVCYEKALAQRFDIASDNFSGRVGKPKLKVPNIAITPQIISEFSVECYGYVDMPNYETATGLYLTALIQKSYGQGHNNFSIETNGLVVGQSLIGLGAYLIGKKENPIKIFVKGDLGVDLGLCAENIAVEVRGNAGMIVAQRAKSSEFVLDGLLFGAGAFSENCVFKSKSKAVLSGIKKTKAVTNATLYWVNRQGKDVLYARVTSKL